MCFILQDDGSSVNVHINLQATTQVHVPVFVPDKHLQSVLFLSADIVQYNAQK